MAKYDPLKNFLLNLPKNQKEVTLSFEEIERIIQAKLPFSAAKHRAWWSNEKNGVHVSAHAWMDAGWKVDAINLSDCWVRFIRDPALLKNKTKSHPPLPNIKTNRIAVKKTMFSANRPVKTLVIHKPECRVIPWANLDECGCGYTGEHGNQRWFCESDITRQAVDEFMKGRFWAILLCDICFRGEQ